MDFSTTLLYLFRMIGALLLIVWLAHYLLKKLNRSMRQPGKLIHVLERQPINKTASLNIVAVGSHYYLMSFSEKGIECIKEYTKEEADELRLQIIQLKEQEETDKKITHKEGLSTENWQAALKQAIQKKHDGNKK
ncbi:flagellar biosynthetic protein FliO [Lacticigenium naphthae]|uniref:flagellar biosynthetic protein FliO n=1 Tax=Lacticigenium naphthae TaxID=515351 RepID=UPI0004282488|nr:flagellar biosynthetic protein FliO [Lacticigenium naphthae]